jgi:hypothetical protein
MQAIELEGGLEALGPPGLMARRVEPDGTVWATRGFALYRRPRNTDQLPPAMARSLIPCQTGRKS